MREILFRGKRINNGEWIFGSLIVDCENYYIHMNTGIVSISENTAHTPYNENSNVVVAYTHKVDPKTVGQFAGWNNKNHARIFEGDIVSQEDETGTVRYEGNYCTFAVILKRNTDLFQHIKYGCEILGNIHDNPELIDKCV